MSPWICRAELGAIRWRTAFHGLAPSATNLLRSISSRRRQSVAACCRTPSTPGRQSPVVRRTCAMWSTTRRRMPVRPFPQPVMSGTTGAAYVGACTAGNRPLREIATSRRARRVGGAGEGQRDIDRRQAGADQQHVQRSRPRPSDGVEGAGASGSRTKQGDLPDRRGCPQVAGPRRADRQHGGVAGDHVPGRRRATTAAPVGWRPTTRVRRRIADPVVEARTASWSVSSR